MFLIFLLLFFYRMKVIVGILMVLGFMGDFVAGQNYQLHKHVDKPEAKCIDGSPSALYISEGLPDKILIYFQGGGMCSGSNLAQTLQNCYNRSKTAYGSSTTYPQILPLQSFTILSPDSTINPLYSKWTKIFIPYCDGVLHQGSRNSSIEYKGTQLYLRGMENTKAHFQYLEQRFGLYRAKEVVVSGTSAGAIAAMGWANYLYKNMGNPQGLLVIYDSGLFISDYLNPFTNSTPGLDNYKSIKTLAFTEKAPPFPQCLQQQPRENCDKFGVLINYILPPVFAIQSQYDLYAINNILLLKCPQKTFPASLQKCTEREMGVIEDYRGRVMGALGNLTKVGRNGLWAVSCSQHGFLYNNHMYNSDTYKIPQRTGKTILSALEDFLSGSGTKINIDSTAWPQNEPCNGYATTNLKSLTESES